METITLDEARKRFGELLHGPTKTYQQVDDPDGGIWRPIYVGRELTGYGLYKLNRVTKKRPSRWKRR